MFQFETKIDINPKVGSIEEEREENAILGFRPGNPWLSNFHPSPVIAYGIPFPTVEHAYAASKVDHGHSAIDRRNAFLEMRKISRIESPAAAKRHGRYKVKLRPDWDNMKVWFMRTLVWRKFEIPDLRALLLETEGRRIWELNNHKDTFFGVVDSRGSVVGRNILGEIQMDTRSMIAALLRPELEVTSHEI